jgi:hypothetical protein
MHLHCMRDSPVSVLFKDISEIHALKVADSPVSVLFKDISNTSAEYLRTYQTRALKETDMCWRFVCHTSLRLIFNDI